MCVRVKRFTRWVLCGNATLIIFACCRRTENLEPRNFPEVVNSSVNKSTGAQLHKCHPRRGGFAEETYRFLRSRCSLLLLPSSWRALELARLGALYRPASVFEGDAVGIPPGPKPTPGGSTWGGGGGPPWPCWPNPPWGPELLLVMAGK